MLFFSHRLLPSSVHLRSCSCSWTNWPLWGLDDEIRHLYLTRQFRRATYSSQTESSVWSMISNKLTVTIRYPSLSPTIRSRPTTKTADLRWGWTSAVHLAVYGIPHRCHISHPCNGISPDWLVCKQLFNYTLFPAVWLCLYITADDNGDGNVIFHCPWGGVRFHSTGKSEPLTVPLPFTIYHLCAEL